MPARSAPAPRGLPFPYSEKRRPSRVPPEPIRTWETDPPPPETAVPPRPIVVGQTLSAPGPVSAEPGDRRPAGNPPPGAARIDHQQGRGPLRVVAFAESLEV